MEINDLPFLQLIAIIQLKDFRLSIIRQFVNLNLQLKIIGGRSSAVKILLMRSFILFISIFFSTILGAQIYIVNTSDDSDDGICNGLHCSFREAVNASEGDGVASTINFNIPGTGPHSIVPNGPFPTITKDDLSILGNSQPGAPGAIIIDFNFRKFAGNPFWRVNAKRFQLTGIEFADFYFFNDGDCIFQFGDVFNASDCKISLCSFINSEWNDKRTQYLIYIIGANDINITNNNFGTDHSRSFISKLGGCISISSFQQIGKVTIASNLFVNKLRAIECLAGDINISKNIFGALDTFKAVNFLNPELAIWATYLYGGVINDNFFFGYGNGALSIQHTYGYLTISKNRFYDNTGPGVVYLYSNSNSPVYITNNYATLQSNNSLNKPHTFIHGLDNITLFVERNEISNYGTFLIAEAPQNYLFTRYRHIGNKLKCMWANAVVMKGHPRPTISSVNSNLITGIGNPNDSIVVYSNSRLTCPEAICQGGVELGRTHADTSGNWILNATSINNSSISAFQYSIDPNVKPYIYSEFSDCNQLIIQNDDPISNSDSNIIKVYPNPVSDQLKIELNESEPLTILIYNSNGHELSQQFTNSKFIEIDLYNFNPGIYYLQFLSNDFQQIKKIIKN